MLDDTPSFPVFVFQFQKLRFCNCVLLLLCPHNPLPPVVPDGIHWRPTTASCREKLILQQGLMGWWARNIWGDVPIKPVGGHWVDLRAGGWCSPNLPPIPEYPGTRKILGGLGGVGSYVPPRSYVMDIAPLLLSYWNFWPFQNICFACLGHEWYIYVTGLFNYSEKSILGQF